MDPHHDCSPDPLSSPIPILSRSLHACATAVTSKRMPFHGPLYVGYPVQKDWMTARAWKPDLQG